MAQASRKVTDNKSTDKHSLGSEKRKIKRLEERQKISQRLSWVVKDPEFTSAGTRLSEGAQDTTWKTLLRDNERHIPVSERICGEA